MKTKNLIILCIIFVILVGLIFLKKGMKPQVQTQEEMVDIISQDLDGEDITMMSLRIGDGSSVDEEKPRAVSLAKDDGHWVVQTLFGVSANESSISPVLEKLDQLEGELRSSSAELLGDYGITDDQGVHLEVQGPDGQVYVVIGEKKASFQNNFVRLAATNDVYLVNENILSLLGIRGEGEDRKLDIGKWVDKRIVHLEPNDVVGVEIVQRVEGGAEEKVIDIKKELIEDKQQWKSVQPYAFNLSATNIKSMLQTFSNTYAREVVAPENPEVFDDMGWKGIFTLENGERIQIVRGAKDEEDKNYYVKREGAPYFYLVPVSTFHSREKQQGNILANNPLKVNENNVLVVEVSGVDDKKDFHAVKMEQPVQDQEIEEGQEAQKEVVWQTPKGDDLDKTKVQDVIKKINNLKLEIAPQPVTSLENVIMVQIGMDGGAKNFTISQDIKLDNGKECHFLKMENDDFGYCVSKPLVSALKNALP